MDSSNALNSFDLSSISWLNHFARRSLLFDSAMSGLLGFDLLKGGLFVTVMFWFWFAKGNERLRNREIIVASFIASMAAFAVGRVLAKTLPFRLRPIAEATLGFVVPYGVEILPERGWSSFPSDHAMLFCALTTGLTLISPLTGIIAFVYTAAVILFPRIYLGWHYPTDVLAGAAIGIVFALLANRAELRRRLSAFPLRLAEVRPNVFYALAFLFLFQIATMFNGPFTLLFAAKTVLGGERERAALEASSSAANPQPCGPGSTPPEPSSQIGRSTTLRR